MPVGISLWCSGGYYDFSISGAEKQGEVKRSYYLNLLFSLVLAGIFTMVCVLLPDQIMGLYTKDTATRTAAAKYLCIFSGTFFPMAGATLLATLFRCM